MIVARCHRSWSGRACPPRIPRHTAVVVAIALATACCSRSALFAAVADTDAQEHAAIVAAVDRVAPAVVRIETVGGLERVGHLLLGNGPTTGLVVDPSGYVVSSAFNFVHKPSSIIVRLPDGVRKPARLVATDHSRMIVLLKIDADKPLPSVSPLANGRGSAGVSPLPNGRWATNTSPLPLGEGPGVRAIETAPLKDMCVGQWAIAVGRTFDGDRPNIAVGILSALNRVWGKAIQTDAAVSPNNYGGPLVDVRGRVLGVLAPLSPQAEDEMVGVEWYDSGIGFAIPMEHIQSVLPRLMKGEDLYPGRAGFSIKGPNPYTGAPILAVCRAGAPAATAGLKPGDRIVEIDGRKVSRAAEVKEEIYRRYAGQKMRVTVMRGQQRVECQFELTAKLPPFQHGFLGILPMRAADGNGVRVRWVYPKSPAAAAGIKAGDAIVSLQNEPVATGSELRLKLGAMEPATEVELEVAGPSGDPSDSGKGRLTRKLKVVLARIPEELPPDELPPARNQAEQPKADRPAVGAIRLNASEFSNETWAYVPERYEAEVPHGVVVWLHGAGGFDWPELLQRWKPLCDRHDLILVAPKSNDANRWMPEDAALIDRLLGNVAAKYRIDPARVVLHGYESGGTLALTTGLRHREAISAVAAVEAAPGIEPAENDPLGRLAIYLAVASKSRVAQSTDLTVTALRKKKIPVTVKDLGEAPRYLNAEELAELTRWIDTLDRI
jgi:serine protease Do